MRPSTQRGSPLSRSAVSTYCRLSSSFSYETDPENERRFDGRRFRPTPELHPASRRRAPRSSCRARARRPAASRRCRGRAAPRSSRASAARDRPGACACPPRPGTRRSPRARHLFLNWPEASSSVCERVLQAAEVPLVLARELDRVAAEDALRRRLRPAEEHLVGDQVGLAEVADVVQVEPRRVPVEVVGEAQPAGVGAAEAHHAAVAGERGGVRVDAEVARVGPLVVVDRVRLQGEDRRGVARHAARDAVRLEHPLAVGEVTGEVDPARGGLGRQEGDRGVADPAVGGGQHAAQAGVALVPVLVKAADREAAERLDHGVARGRGAT